MAETLTTNCWVTSRDAEGAKSPSDCTLDEPTGAKVENSPLPAEMPPAWGVPPLEPEALPPDLTFRIDVPASQPAAIGGTAAFAFQFVLAADWYDTYACGATLAFDLVLIGQALRHLQQDQPS